jgi:hypothetical protein
MLTLPNGPICILGLDSKFKADFIISAATSNKIIMWPELHMGTPKHPYHLKLYIERFIEDNESVIFVTQSPIVVSAFNDIPENVYITDRQRTYQLIEKYSKEWLLESETDLGNLYISGALEDNESLEYNVHRILGWI